MNSPNNKLNAYAWYSYNAHRDTWETLLSTHYILTHCCFSYPLHFCAFSMAGIVEDTFTPVLQEVWFNTLSLEEPISTDIQVLHTDIHTFPYTIS